MSEFFSDLGKAARRVVSNVGTEVSVAALEQKVKEAYQSLGWLYHEAVRAGEEPRGEAFDTQLQKISDLKEQIKEKRRNQKVSDDDFEEVL